MLKGVDFTDVLTDDKSRTQQIVVRNSQVELQGLTPPVGTPQDGELTLGPGIGSGGRGAPITGPKANSNSAGLPC